MKVALEDGREVEIRKPNAKQLADAQKHASKVFVRLINEKDENGNPVAIFRSQLAEHMERIGLWAKDDDEKLDKLDEQIMQKERAATETRSRSAARQLAIDIRGLRGQKLELINRKNQLNSYTVEGQVSDAKFDYLVSLCVYNTDGTRFFDGVEDYQERADTPEAAKVAFELSKMIYGIDDDFHAKLFENKILQKIGAVDDQFRLVDGDGKLIDASGKRIDDEGFWLNDNGQRVDEDGNLLEYNVDDVVYDEE